MSESAARIPASLRTEALEQLLTEQGLVDPKVLDTIITTYETNIGPLNGAKVIAKAWTDPEFRRWLLDDGTAAIRRLGYIGVQTEHVVVVENTATSHHVAVCTLCSCYPWQLLGLPPSWYKDPAAGVLTDWSTMPDTDATEPTAVDSSEVEPPEDSVVGDTPTTDTEDPDDDQDDDEADTFSRTYVEGLRRENARYRERACNADTYAKRLHTELVRAIGKLADSTDLEFAEEHLEDPGALAAAIDEMLTGKPHLASRRPFGEIGLGPSPSPATVDLAALLRQRAR